MNILIFTDTFKPQINGLVTAISIFKEGAEKQGHKVYIVAPAVKKYKSSDKNIIFIPSVPFIFLPEYRITFLISIKILRLIKKTKFDVIHTHTPFSLGIMGAICGKLFHIPVIHTYHTYFEEYIHYLKLPGYIGKAVAKYFSKFYCEITDKIIVPSSFIKAVLKSYKIKRNISVLPTGIDISKFKVKNREKHIWKHKYKLNPEDKILLYTGRLAKEKNLYTLIDIFKKIRLKHRHIKLMLVGDGPEKNHLINYAVKLNIYENTIFTGFIPRNKIKFLYAISDIFVFPSLTETQGLVLLEAMASHIPIVAFYKRGTKSVLPNSKIIGISPVKTKQEFFNEIEFYLNYKNYEKIKKNLTDFVKKFNYMESTEKLISHYNTILSQKQIYPVL